MLKIYYYFILDKNMNNEKSSKQSSTYTCRFCHIKKSKYFKGYGFNLESKSNKKCHQIGIVDENSPAHLAGIFLIN
jgi:hypothetical protein